MSELHALTVPKWGMSMEEWKKTTGHGENAIFAEKKIHVTSDVKMLSIVVCFSLNIDINYY